MKLSYCYGQWLTGESCACFVAPSHIKNNHLTLPRCAWDLNPPPLDLAGYLAQGQHGYFIQMFKLLMVNLGLSRLLLDRQTYLMSVVLCVSIYGHKGQT